MTNKIRYGDYFREASIERNIISYDDLVPELQYDSEGNALPYQSPKIQLRAFDVYRIIMPYTQVRIIEQMKAVLPLALYLVFFQILILRQSVQDSSTIAVGLIAVILGLMFFMEGLKVGLMPLGETLGSSLPVKSTLPVVLFITCLLGIGVTDESEREIFSVIVKADQADDIFEYIYENAEINKPHGGIIYQHALHQSSEFVLPDVPEENKKEK